MRKIAIALVGILVAGLAGFLVYENRREAKAQRATAIDQCVTWSFFDQEKCEELVDAGKLEERVQGEIQAQLVTLRLDVSLARQSCTELDAAIHYVGLQDRAIRGTLTPEQKQTALQLLGQGFDCESAATTASIEFRDTQQALADMQRAAGFAVTAHGVELPDLDTPAVEASKAESDRSREPG
ncbi:MAG: hypothetical protein IAG13_11305 [Deltaproteobacteria bacterium]|nr:hypothetical protein [Nannocystaceae bacterium]